MDVELRHLRAFVAVATCRSYTAASRQLLVGQPALTRTIQQLEDALGVRLLERTSRSVSLSEVGETFLNDTLAVLADLDRAVSVVRGQQQLRIGFQWVLPDAWASETFRRFEASTGAAVTLLRRDDVGVDLERGDLDVAVTRTQLRNAGIVHTALFDEERVAAVSARSALATQGHLEWLDLAQQTIVINTVNGTTQRDSWPTGHQPAHVLECGNYDEWLELVAADRGVGAVPRSAARIGGHPGVTYVPLIGAPPVTVSFAYLPRRRSNLVRRLVQHGLDVASSVAAAVEAESASERPFWR